MNDYFRYAGILINISVLITAFEHLMVRVTSSDALLPWNILQLRESIFTRSRTSEKFSKLYNLNVIYLFYGMVALSITGILLLLLPPYLSNPTTITIQSIFLALLLITFNYRSRYALDGADQFNTIALVCMAISMTLEPSTGQIYFMAFISFQATLSYFIAGVFKLKSPVWKSGNALPDIFAGKTYGHKRIAILLDNNQSLAKGLSSLVVYWELFFPLCFLLPAELFYVYLVVGVGFHVFNAVFMGLNCFMLSFLSSYPVMIYCHQFLHEKIF